MGTRFKKLLAGILCGLLSLILGFVVVPRFNSATREVIIVPMLAKGASAGTMIRDTDIKMVEVGKYNLPSDVIRDKGRLVNMYAAKDIEANRYLYGDDVSREQTDTSLVHRIKNGGVSIQTDLAKCAGGIPKPGDYVKIYVVTRDEAARAMKSTLYKALAQVEVLDILNANGQPITKASNNEAFSGTGKETIPAYILLNTQYNLQEQLLIDGSYNGAIHLSLINPENLDKSLINIDMSKLDELEKEGAEILTSTAGMPADSGGMQETSVGSAGRDGTSGDGPTSLSDREKSRNSADNTGNRVGAANGTGENNNSMHKGVGIE